MTNFELNFELKGCISRAGCEEYKCPLVLGDLIPEWFGTLIRLICADPKLADIIDKNQHVPLGDLIDDPA